LSKLKETAKKQANKTTTAERQQLPSRTSSS